ncbi:uncharacterized protein LOC116415895 isoform X2 [Nasonia vitripennis]|uniref:Uncharacterized protein n=1 Tax=Nasonia vitripennis TaxID=7425 RepID=A0A7M7T6B9_NASVI|nr:uncharacterized protein LOC116415895 isoform X2 [Nasonia vitripennis]
MNTSISIMNNEALTLFTSNNSRTSEKFSNVRNIGRPRRQKKQWLVLRLSGTISIIDLEEEIACPTLNAVCKNNDEVHCTNHKLCSKDSVCAIKNAFALRKWLKEQERTCLKESMRLIATHSNPDSAVEMRMRNFTYQCIIDSK